MGIISFFRKLPPERKAKIIFMAAGLFLQISYLVFNLNWIFYFIGYGLVIAVVFHDLISAYRKKRILDKEQRVLDIVIKKLKELKEM